MHNREYIKLLNSDIAANSEKYYETKLPRKMLDAYLFPAESQCQWQVTHPTQHYTLEAGVCEGCPEEPPMVVTIKEIAYFLALISLFENSPDGEKVVTTWQIAYFVAGCLGTCDEIENARTRNLLRDEDFGDEYIRGMEKLAGRHLLYIVPETTNSSAPGIMHWLSLINYSITTLPEYDERSPFLRCFSNIEKRPGFQYLAPEVWDWYTVDLKMFFSLRSWLAKAVYLKLLPQLLDDQCDGPEHPLELDGHVLLKDVGAPSEAYGTTSEVLRNCNLIAQDMTGTEGRLGRRLMASVLCDDINPLRLIVYLH